MYTFLSVLSTIALVTLSPANAYNDFIEEKRFLSSSCADPSRADNVTPNYQGLVQTYDCA